MDDWLAPRYVELPSTRAPLMRHAPGLLTLSDLLKSYPPPKGDSHVCTDVDVVNAAADRSDKGHWCKKVTGNKIPKRLNKHLVFEFKGNPKLPQCPTCWSPNPPLCTKCCEYRKMHGGKTK